MIPRFSGARRRLIEELQRKGIHDLAVLKAFDEVPRHLFVPSGVQHLSILTSGRFVVAQTPTSYVTHDLELKKTTTTELKDTTALTRELRWLDGYTVWNDHGGTLRMYEFDGANQHEIMPVASGFSVTYSPSAKYLYGINRTDDGKYHLNRVLMILP